MVVTEVVVNLIGVMATTGGCQSMRQTEIVIASAFSERANKHSSHAELINWTFTLVVDENLLKPSLLY